MALKITSLLLLNCPTGLTFHYQKYRWCQGKILLLPKLKFSEFLHNNVEIGVLI